MKRNKPLVLISRCLTFDNCRYDGGIVNDEFIEKLKDHICFETVCPEVEIGLSIPRKWLSLVMHNDKFILYQRETGLDFTDDIVKYSDEIYDKYEDADGFILKGRSPSCGINDVKFYPSKENKIKSGKASGIFANEILKKYPDFPIESEGRLRNFELRETFLTKLYTVFRFKEVLSSQKMKYLVEFHSKHKYLLQSFSELGMRKLGKICANHERKEVKIVIDNYFNVLLEVFRDKRKYTQNINVLEHCFGFISDYLKKDEKDYFFEILKQYREARLPLSVPLKIINGWIIRYEVEYLINQYYFKPYPIELMDIKDSGKGRYY